MIVLNAEPSGYSKKAIESWKQKGYDYRESSWDEIASTKLFEGVTVLIVRLAKYIDLDILLKFPRLSHLVSATTGLDHINQESLRERNINLVSLRGQDAFLQTIPSTAEHTWALLMALMRNIPGANDDVKQGRWNRDNFRGWQLKGKMLGIIGLGRTGKKVAAYARAFDMKVLYYDPYVNDSTYVKAATLEELLTVSDILSLHVHLNDETRHLLAEQHIHVIKPGCLVINTSRGKVLDEEALTRALVNKKIGGIATDVLATELGDIRQSPMWKAQQQNQNIIITPHIGGATFDAMWACEEFIVDLV